MNFEKVKCGSEYILIPIPKNYKDCILLAQSDYYRITGNKPPFWKMLINAFLNVRFGHNFWLRLSAYKGMFYRICSFFLKRYQKRYGIEISPETKIGFGFYIGHFWGIIVNPTAIIGNNVNLSQFTTIGSNDGCAAIVGDNVYVGPNVCIVENIYIESNVTIGAGAVVVKNVPFDVTIAGVPAKVISKKNPGRYTKKRWISDYK